MEAKGAMSFGVASDIMRTCADDIRENESSAEPFASTNLTKKVRSKKQKSRRRELYYRACSGLGRGEPRLELMLPCRKNQALHRGEIPIRWERSVRRHLNFLKFSARAASPATAASTMGHFE